MTNAVINLLNGNFSDTALPKLGRDPVINKGSRYLFDFLDDYCNPNADGALASGVTFNNLVDGAAVATVGASGHFSNLTGKAGLAIDGAGAANTISLGTGYDAQDTNNPFLFIGWFKTPASGYKTPYPQIFYRANVANNEGNTTSQLSLSTGSDGKTPRFALGGSDAFYPATLASGNGLGAVAQVAMSWTPGYLSIFWNGALISKVIGPTTLIDASAWSSKIGGAWLGTLYRLYEEDLALSGLTDVAQVAADYALNSARFT